VECWRDPENDTKQDDLAPVLYLKPTQTEKQQRQYKCVLDEVMIEHPGTNAAGGSGWTVSSIAAQ
jgi:hypothetical protein